MNPKYIFRANFQLGSSQNSITIDGKQYPYVKIGNQLWITQNLAWKVPNYILGTDYRYYNDDISYEERGLLYHDRMISYLASVQYDKGFQVPSSDDFSTLKTYIRENKSGTKSEGYYIKTSDYGGNDEFGFNGYCSGSWSQGWRSEDTDYWTTTSSTNSHKRWYLRKSSTEFTSEWRDNSYHSIRLVKNL